MDKKDKIDLGLKFIALFGAIFSFFFGLYRYAEINRQDSAKAFWNQQFPIYKELCSTTSIIATSKDSAVIQKSISDFWRLYYGEARMVVDGAVHLKMSAFASMLKDVDRSFKPNSDLTLASYELATACRQSMAASWNIPLSELQSE